MGEKHHRNQERSKVSDSFIVLVEIQALLMGLNDTNRTKKIPSMGEKV